MIRQAISCDICGAEKRQTNHWFVAYAHGGELRVTGWTANAPPARRGRNTCAARPACTSWWMNSSPGTWPAGRKPPLPTPQTRRQAVATDTSLTSSAAHPGTISFLARHRQSARAFAVATVIPAAVIAIAPSRAARRPAPSRGRAGCGRYAELRLPPLARRSLGARAGTRTAYRLSESPQKLLTPDQAVQS